MTSERGPEGQDPGEGLPDNQEHEGEIFIAGRRVDLSEIPYIQLEEGPPPPSFNLEGHLLPRPRFVPDPNLEEITPDRTEGFTAGGAEDPTLEEMIRRARGLQPDAADEAGQSPQNDDEQGQGN